MGSKPHILIVDDEADIREPVGTYLGMNGFDITLAASAKEALSAIQQQTPDLALLDIMLGADDGMDLCKKLQNTSDIAVIFLSGKSEETERIIGLELGADDYIVKPFNPRELLARIKAVLRRKGTTSQASPSAMQRVAFGPWIFDPAQHEIVNNTGDVTALSSGETILLQTFLAQPQKIF
ncbi:MAG: response regulator transcription factor, partial [Kordiimonas sp.]